ncbi:VOC family protein [Kitasatospora atroaurantiaca]|uniref:VOC domain-containing protein n=1 Tax=Kitasatospora atroaurantiaca TaxID=285545 RepID=A0A561ELV2_9ACTN|nr:VOC family protein [Kitasatospora atroaurantiaca]TWE16542.1 hypothetical protein FB465_1525 [Kitasatospora atroaurantiaca]
MITTDFKPGSPSWIDLGSPDTEAAATFYGAVFGWSFQSLGPEAGGYGFFQKDGRTVAALGPLTEEGASSAWTIYFQTPDADATTKATEQAGGTVRVEAFDVMEAGRMACLTDPTGAQFSVWQPGTTKGLDAVTDPDTLVWIELHTSDVPKALGFYKALFDWKSMEMEVPGMTYTIVTPAGGAPDDHSAMFGGLAPLQDEHQPTAWIPYFEVTDADAVVARAEAAGGSVMMPAMDAPDIGRMAWLTDPFGAPFAVIKSVPPQNA